MAKQEDNLRAGDVVAWEGETCRVLRRRRVSGLAMFSTSEYEVRLEGLDGSDIGWVPENEVERATDEEDREPGSPPPD